MDTVVLLRYNDPTPSVLLILILLQEYLHHRRAQISVPYDPDEPQEHHQCDERREVHEIQFILAYRIVGIIGKIVEMICESEKYYRNRSY